MRSPSRPARVTLALGALALVQGLVLPAALHYGLRTPKEETVVFDTEQFLKRSQREDSWKPLDAARAYVDSRPGERLYEDVFFDRQIKFQYPPSSLLFLDHASRSTLNAISWIAVATTALLCWTLLHRSLALHAPGWQPTHPVHGAVQAALVVALTVTYYPIVKGYSLGQIQTVLTAACAGTLLLIATNRSLGAGVLAGGAALVKPTYGALLLWALARRQWRCASGLAVTVAGGVVISSAAFGAVQWADYGRVLSFIGRRGEAFYANQSTNGLLHRLMGHGPVLEWQRNQFAPDDPVVRSLTLVSSAVLILVAIYYRRANRVAVPECDFAAFLIAVTAGAPIAWEHHYGVLLPIAAVATGPALSTERRTARAVVLIVSLLVSGQYLTVTHATASTPWSFVMSYTLAAALLLLGVLLSVPAGPAALNASSRGR
jgi:alpha-1,2-mannosyltransferase